MITFPSAYHGGFNHGFNLAESTNFAIDRWIKEGRGAGYCRCSPHSVRIDVDRFEDLVRQHRRVERHGFGVRRYVTFCALEADYSPPLHYREICRPLKTLIRLDPVRGDLVQSHVK